MNRIGGSRRQSKPALLILFVFPSPKGEGFMEMVVLPVSVDLVKRCYFDCQRTQCDSG